MTDRRIFIEHEGRPTRVPFKENEWDFGSVRIGSSSLKIAEILGEFDFDGKKLRIADGVAANHAATKGQVDTVDARVDATNALLNSFQGQIDNNASGVSMLIGAIDKIFNGDPLEEHFSGDGVEANFTATILSWTPDNDNKDILVFVDGRKAVQGHDYNKVSDVEIGFLFAPQDGSRVTIRNPVPYLKKAPFLKYVTGIEGQIIDVGDSYYVGTDKLNVWRNGHFIGRSTTVATPVDRYSEGSPLNIEVGQASAEDDFFVFWHLEQAPDYKVFNSGLTGTSLTVPSYSMGVDQLLVFRNGHLLNNVGLGEPIDQYSEDTSTTLTLDPSVSSQSTDHWLFLHLDSAPTWREDKTGMTGTSVTFSNPFVMGSDRLFVFRNGKLLLNTNNSDYGEAIDRYQESSTTTITLESGLSSEDIITAIYF